MVALAMISVSYTHLGQINLAIFIMAKIKIAGVGGIQRGLDCIRAGVADRPDRQSGAHARMVVAAIRQIFPL